MLKSYTHEQQNPFNLKSNCRYRSASRCLDAVEDCDHPFRQLLYFLDGSCRLRLIADQLEIISSFSRPFSTSKDSIVYRLESRRAGPKQGHEILH
jgi:hypothetical protein